MKAPKIEMGPAMFSEDRAYRYTLNRHWQEGKSCMWIGLNPSTADEKQLDPTLRRVARFSAEWGFAGFTMTNLFAYRATVPRVMLLQADPVGPANDFWLKQTASVCDTIVCAWGAHGVHRDRSRYVVDMLREAGHGHKMKCLGMTQKGEPKHPLYLHADTALIPCP